jgi:hypothetical protein
MITDKVKDAQVYSKWFNFIMVGVYILSILCIGPAMYLGAINDPDLSSESGAFLGSFFAICLSVAMLPFLGFYLYLGLKIEKKSQFIYYGNFVALGLACTSLLTLPFGIIGIMKWADSAVKEYYIEKK